MPSVRDHDRVEKAKGIKRSIHHPVNSFMDSTASIHGPKHREDFIHSPEFCDLLDKKGLPEPANVCWDHLDLDNKCDKFKEQDKDTWRIQCKLEIEKRSKSLQKSVVN